MAYAHVAHDCIIGNKVIMANSVNLAGHVEVGDCVVISGMAAVQQWIKIGEYAFLGGASGYNLDIPPYMLAHGVRGRLFGPNLIGLKRHGFTAKACQALKKAYRIIFRSGLGKEEALARCGGRSLPGFRRWPSGGLHSGESKNGVAPAASKNGNGEIARRRSVHERSTMPSSDSIAGEDGSSPCCGTRASSPEATAWVVGRVHRSHQHDVAALADVFKETQLGQLGKSSTISGPTGSSASSWPGPSTSPRPWTAPSGHAGHQLVFKRKDKGDDALLRSLAREFESRA
jgi:hypothetical protein